MLLYKLYLNALRTSAFMQGGTMLNDLPGYGSYVMIHKSMFSVNDLAALTAYTGHEFAMFTLSGRRIIIRGNREGVQIPARLLPKLKRQK